jgi:DNA repair protein RadD
MRLRDYQAQAVEAVINTMPFRPVLVSPTGSGKTVMGTEIVRRASSRCLWLAHRTELIEQAAVALHERGLDTGIIKSGIRPTTSAPVQVASVFSLANREMPPCDLIIVDEAHHAKANSYLAAFDRAPGVPVVGLTATPFRLDGQGLGDIFGHIVVAARTRELVDSGALVNPRLFVGTRPDMSTVKIAHGDYNQKAAAEAMLPLHSVIVEEWQRLAHGKKTVAFCVRVSDSMALRDAFRAQGIRAEHIDGRTHGEERAAILAALAAHEIDVLCNCMVLTEGWDLPSLECAIIARPTAALALWLQMVGRVMRPGKAEALVLDFTGNIERHGAPTRHIEYSLTSKQRPEPMTGRACPACQFIVDAFPCPECGHTPAVSQAVEPDRGEIRLVEYDPEDDRRIWNQCMELCGDERYARARFHGLTGSWPVIADGQYVIPSEATMDQKRIVYADLCLVAASKNYKPGWASHRYRQIFGVWPKGFVSSVRAAACR